MMGRQERRDVDMEERGETARQHARTNEFTRPALETQEVWLAGSEWCRRQGTRIHSGSVFYVESTQGVTRGSEKQRTIYYLARAR